MLNRFRAFTFWFVHLNRIVVLVHGSPKIAMLCVNWDDNLIDKSTVAARAPTRSDLTSVPLRRPIVTAIYARIVAHVLPV